MSIIKKSHSFTYLLFANVLENELSHFYIPNNILSDSDRRTLIDASDPISDKKSKDIICKKMQQWASYVRYGPQNIIITQTYCVSYMNE